MVIFLKVLRQRETLFGVVSEVIRDHIDVAAASCTADAMRVGNRADEQRSCRMIDNGALRFEPRPAAIVIDDNRICTISAECSCRNQQSRGERDHKQKSVKCGHIATLQQPSATTRTKL